MEFDLLGGLIGMPDATRFELLVNDEEFPFMWIRCVDRHDLGFVVIEPSQFVGDYEVEIADDDASLLDISSPEDAMFLNIVTLRDGSLESATVNMIGPIVLNKRILVGKQVIVSNYSRYSARHPLVAESAVGA